MRAGLVAACVMLCALVAGCGGGGGGSGGSTGGSGSGNGGGGGSGNGGGGSTPAYSVSVKPGNLQFTANVGESAPPPQTVTATFVGDGLIVGFAPGVPQPGWLKVEVVGSPAASPALIRFSINAGTFVAAAALTTSVRFISGRADGSQVVTQDVPVTLTIRDPFAINKTSLELDAVEGMDSNALNVMVSGENIRWSATADQSWVHLTPASGSAASSMAVTASAASLAAGTYTSQVRLTDSVSQTVLTLPVTLYVAGNRWNVSKTGVLLLEFSDAAAPTRTIRITNDRNVSAAWTASSDVNWLTATASGGNGDSLTVQANANAAALSADTVHIGTVTVAGAGLQNDQLRVGYYRSSQAKPTQLAATVQGLSDSTRPAAVIADPVRPYAYIAFGTDRIYRVNFTTGVVDNLMATTNAIFISPVVSGDGHYLYAMDVKFPGATRVLDLDTAQPYATWSRGTGCCAGDERAFTWMRPHGVPVLVNVNFEVRNAVTGVLATPRVKLVDSPEFWSMQAVPDGSGVYYFYVGNSGCHRADRYALTTRPATGEGFLTLTGAISANAPDDNGCVTINDIAPSFADTFDYFIGFRGNGYSRLFRRNTDNTITEINRQWDYGVLKMSDSQRKLASFHGPSAEQVRVFNADDTVAADLGNFFDIYDVAFAGDERFGLVLGSSLTGSTGAGLFIFGL